MWGAIIGLGASLLGGFMQKKQADKQSEVAEDNSEQMKKEAEYQQFRTSVLLRRQKDYTQKLLGAQRAAYAKSGIQVDTGTALTVAEETAAQAAEDAFLIRQEGQFNYEKAMLGIKSYQQDAKDYKTAGYIEAGTTVLTGVAKYGQSAGWWS